ncbi:unnamed protein product [Colias eurytheme]|nr:unnamed protein product [Colias eurytheme]
MNTLILISALSVVVLCAPSINRELMIRRALPALEQEEVHDEYGQYAYRYVTAEGTVVSQRGWLVPNGRGGYVLVSEGQYSYIGDDGELYITKYYAGINGTHMETEHYSLEELRARAEEESRHAQ